MAKKKSSARSQTQTNPNRPLFIKMEGDEASKAIAEEDSNLFVGCIRPHPTETAGASAKRVDIPRWKQYHAAKIRSFRRQPNGAGEGLVPSSAQDQMGKLLDLLKTDYCKDPAYAQYRRCMSKTVFFKRLYTVEQDMGLNPPPHPTPGFPGVNY